jgi:hypothetical protein
MDVEKRERIIRGFAEKIATLQHNEMVHQKLIEELRNRGVLGILEDLDRIRNSPEVLAAYVGYLESVEKVAELPAGTLSDHARQELLRLKPEQTGGVN